MINAEITSITENKKASTSITKKNFVTKLVKPAQLHRSEWQGHPTRSRLLSLKKGSIAVHVVKPDNWIRPAHNLPVSQYVLNFEKPHLEIPGGYVISMKAIEKASTVEVAIEKPEDSKGDFSFERERWYFDSFF